MNKLTPEQLDELERQCAAAASELREHVYHDGEGWRGELSDRRGTCYRSAPLPTLVEAADAMREQVPEWRALTNGDWTTPPRLGLALIAEVRESRAEVTALKAEVEELRAKTGDGGEVER
jgi:hypothetical protein